MRKERPRGISSRLYEILNAAKPEDLVQRQWLMQAGISTSFFTDLRNGREPGIDKVEALARQVGLTLTELLDGHEPPAFPLPSVDELMQLVADAQDEVPSGASYGDWPRYVAQALRPRLERYIADRRSDPYASKTSADDEDAQARTATRQGARAG